MKREEIDKLQLPCLLWHKHTGLVVQMETTDGNCGTGITMHSGSSSHVVGVRWSNWNMGGFYAMENNNLYGYIPQG